MYSDNFYLCLSSVSSQCDVIISQEQTSERQVAHNSHQKSIILQCDLGDEF